MGRGFHYNIHKDKTYFLTMTVIDWIDLFTRITQKQLIVDSLKYCQENKGLNIFGWCLTQVRDLLLHIKRIDFARYDYINSEEEKAKNLNLDNYWKLGQGEIIHSTIVKDEIIDKFLVPMQTILRGVVRMPF